MYITSRYQPIIILFLSKRERQRRQPNKEHSGSKKPGNKNSNFYKKKKPQTSQPFVLKYNFSILSKDALGHCRKKP